MKYHVPVLLNESIKGLSIKFYGEILKPDGSKIHKDTWFGKLSDAADICKNAGNILKEKGGDGFFK